MVWGQVGRAYLRPLYWFREADRENTPLTSRHRVCLRWWQRMLQTEQAQLIPWDTRIENADADFLLFSDAEGGGGTGAVLFPRGAPTGGPTSWYTAGRVPRKWRSRLKARKTQINDQCV